MIFWTWGSLSPVAPETRPTATLDVSPLGEISPVDANRQRGPRGIEALPVRA